MTTLTVALIAAAAGIAGGLFGWALCAVAHRADVAAEAAYRRVTAEAEQAAATEAIAAGAPVSMGDFLDNQCLEIRRLPGSELPARRPSA